MRIKVRLALYRLKLIYQAEMASTPLLVLTRRVPELESYQPCLPIAGLRLPVSVP